MGTGNDRRISSNFIEYLFYFIMCNFNKMAAFQKIVLFCKRMYISGLKISKISFFQTLPKKYM